MVIITIIK